jgi:hypothetical protein
MNPSHLAGKVIYSELWIGSVGMYLCIPDQGKIKMVAEILSTHVCDSAIVTKIN